jgi:hypothetical protein
MTFDLGLDDPDKSDDEWKAIFKEKYLHDAEVVIRETMPTIIRVFVGPMDKTTFVERMKSHGRTRGSAGPTT